MVNPIWRPMKYRRFITMLEDEKVYCPARIVRLAETNDLFNSELEGPRLKKAKIKARHPLARFRTNKMFPREGDGQVERIRGVESCRKRAMNSRV